MAKKSCKVCRLPYPQAVAVTRLLLEGASPRQVAKCWPTLKRSDLERHMRTCYARYLKRTGVTGD